MNKITMALAAFLVQAAPAVAYPLVDAQCKDDPKACVVAGKLAYVSIYGLIGKEDLAFFTMVDANLPPGVPFPRVELNSGGGWASKAMEIGRILRRHRAVAETGSPVIPDSTPQCSSACGLVAAGATHRRLTHIGVHTGWQRKKVAPNVWKTVQADGSDVEAYLREMGFNPKLIEIEHNTPYDQITNFFYDPKVPLEEQDIYQFGLYSSENQYFSANQDAALGRGDFKTDEDYMVNAANYGSIQAMRDLADDKLAYVRNQKPDFEGANHWLQMAADKGDAGAIHSLGYQYSYGLGVTKDEAKGASLYLKAAKLGFAPSQNNLGWDYYTGVGVPRNLPDAIYWITRAAAQGEPFAYGSLCEISGATDLYKTDPTEAFMWCGLAVHNLRDGAAKDAAQAVYDRIMKTITPADFAAGSLELQKWEDEVVTVSQMKNVGDDLN